jgi:LysR family nod box-dependent transcriptional activator
MPNYSPVPLAIAGTGRIASVPARLAEFYCRSLPLRIAIPKVDMPPMIELLQWHTSRADDTGLASLPRLISEVAGEVEGRGISASSAGLPR